MEKRLAHCQAFFPMDCFGTSAVVKHAATLLIVMLDPTLYVPKCSECYHPSTYNNIALSQPDTHDHETLEAGISPLPNIINQPTGGLVKIVANKQDASGLMALGLPNSGECGIMSSLASQSFSFH